MESCSEHSSARSALLRKFAFQSGRERITQVTSALHRELSALQKVQLLAQSGALATIITKRVPKENVSSYGVVVTDDEGRVKAFQEKPGVDEALSDEINTALRVSFSEKPSVRQLLIFETVLGSALELT